MLSVSNAPLCAFVDRYHCVYDHSEHCRCLLGFLCPDSVCACLCVCLCMCLCLFVFVYACVCLFLCVFICVCVYLLLLFPLFMAKSRNFDSGSRLWTVGSHMNCSDTCIINCGQITFKLAVSYKHLKFLIFRDILNTDWLFFSLSHLAQHLYN